MGVIRVGKRVILEVINDLYSEPDKRTGRDKLIKKNIRTKMEIDTDMFEMPIEIINSRGNVVRNRCKIYIRDVGPMIVGHSFQEIVDLKNEGRPEHTVVKGFRR